MADNKFIAISHLISCLGALSCLVLQLQTLLFLWKFEEIRRNNNLVTSILRRRRYFIQKLKRRRERNLLKKKRSCWYKPGRTSLWWDNILTGIAPHECWKKNFRLSKDLFFKLHDEISPYISPDLKTPNHRALSSKTKLALTLYFFKDTGSLGMTANSFGVAINTAAAVITEVCNAISKHLSTRYIHLPTDTDSMRRKVSEFEAKFGMINAFGCIDGTHIPIKCPIDDSQDLFCYKQYFSLNVQAVL